MAEEKKRVSLQVLRQLIPVSQLTQDNLRDLADKTYVETLSAGRQLFQADDNDNYSFYLIAGEIGLADGTGEKVVVGGSQAARFPLDHHRPRQATATARTNIEFLRIDNDLLDILLTWDQNAGYMVTEIEEQNDADDTDWMTNILRSSLFHRIPPTNIQAMFMRMQPVPVKAGEVIIRQGDEGDYYYYMSKGRCLVTRDASKSDKVIKLAELDAGASFGEEALISGARRNANVTMLTDGTLMRLGKADFEALLKAPILSSVNFEQAQELVRKGAVWLDVRLENEHKNYAIPGSLHVPLYLLRIKAPALDKGRKYIVYCDTGRRSSSAAYLLSERGFDAHVLKGGLMAIKQEHTA
ncbi:MAG: cyclic nucleotide-binding domain-containing protein [Gammaproteobacteria bacterium]|nr:cyclic nucleotide-binding domain-containing protein [Gammaproteobacteria bacterium]